MKVALFAAPAAGLAALLALAPLADAQCFAPDNLDGPCCSPVQLQLPPLLPWGLEGSGVCFQNCGAPTQNPLKVEAGPPSPTGVCGEFRQPLRVTDAASGVPLLEGDLVLDYTRTWSEIASTTTPPTEYQVWRFAAKVDLRATPGTIPICPVPSCLPVTQTAFYYGYYDLVLNCATGAFEHALVIFHGCDRLVHKPGLSDKPGAFHPGRSYAIVAPDTAANPFVPAFSPPTGGPVVAEALRDVVPVFGPGVCQAEEKLSGGFYASLGSGCFCPLGLAPAQQSAKILSATGSCPDLTGVPGSVASLNAFPTAPWIHLLSTSIGRWTTSASYPGPERAWVVEGLLGLQDPCADPATGVGVPYLEIHYGAETDDGFTVLPDPATGISIPDEFFDTASNFSLPPGVPIPATVLGSVRPTDHVVYLNTP